MFASPSFFERWVLFKVFVFRAQWCLRYLIPWHNRLFIFVVRLVSHRIRSNLPVKAFLWHYFVPICGKTPWSTSLWRSSWRLICSHKLTEPTVCFPLVRGLSQLSLRPVLFSTTDFREKRLLLSISLRLTPLLHVDPWCSGRALLFRHHTPTCRYRVIIHQAAVLSVPVLVCWSTDGCMVCSDSVVIADFPRLVLAS